MGFCAFMIIVNSKDYVHLNGSKSTKIIKLLPQAHKPYFKCS